MAEISSFRNTIFQSTNIEDIFNTVKKRMGGDIYYHIPMTVEQFELVLYESLNFYLDNNLLNTNYVQGIIKKNLIKKAEENVIVGKGYYVDIPEEEAIYVITEIVPVHPTITGYAGTFPYGGMTGLTSMGNAGLGTLSSTSLAGYRQMYENNRAMISQRVQWTFDFSKNKLYVGSNRYDLYIRGVTYSNGMLSFLQRSDVSAYLELATYNQIFKNIALLKLNDEAITYDIEFLQNKVDEFKQMNESLKGEGQDMVDGFSFG